MEYAKKYDDVGDEGLSWRWKFTQQVVAIIIAIKMVKDEEEEEEEGPPPLDIVADVLRRSG